MKLAEVIAAMQPLLEGRGAGLPRTEIYGEFCRAHRRNALLHVYTETAAALGDFDAWVERYFLAHPMTSVELNENGAHFAEFLQRQGADVAIVELADREWWEWRTLTARDDDAGHGLRIAPTVELRPYTRPEAHVIIFWRDSDLDARWARATQQELAVLQAVFAGATPPPSETLDDLIAAGILRT